MNKRLIVTILAGKEYPPIRICVQIPEDLALKIMATPVQTVELGIEDSLIVPTGKINLDDFKIKEGG